MTFFFYKFYFDTFIFQIYSQFVSRSRDLSLRHNIRKLAFNMKIHKNIYSSIFFILFIHFNKIDIKQVSHIPLTNN